LDLRKYFGGNVVREILLAAAGVKVSRTCLSDASLEMLRSIARVYGFAVTASSERYIHRRDIGKGGMANAIERVAAPDEEDGLRNVYIAIDAGLAESTEMLEQAGDDEIFGTLLGIPSCCRNAYVRLSSRAAANQNDFVLLTLDGTPGPMPYDFWSNYPANYFGAALLSFFPCSFRCSSAASVAKSTFRMLSVCDEAWAGSLVERQRTNILYTEYEGLHSIRAPLVNGCIRYEVADCKPTETNRVSRTIQAGNRLQVKGKHEVLVYRDAKLVDSLKGPDVGMCVFR
jgi:hypothetical protein